MTDEEPVRHGSKGVPGGQSLRNSEATLLSRRLLRRPSLQ